MNRTADPLHIDLDNQLLWYLLGKLLNEVLLPYTKQVNAFFVKIVDLYAITVAYSLTSPTILGATILLHIDNLVVYVFEQTMHTKHNRLKILNNRSVINASYELYEWVHYKRGEFIVAAELVQLKREFIFRHLRKKLIMRFAHISVNDNTCKVFVDYRETAMILDKTSHIILHSSSQSLEIS